MKTLIVGVIVTTLLLISTFAVSAQTASLEITVTNIREVKGLIMASLFTEKSKFLKEEYKGKVTKVTEKTMTLLFENLPAGTYAVSVIHDENENKELDSNFMGIPKEGFGFGNNALGRFGPPDFEDTVVELKPGRTRQSIALKYY
jgi:uncharacterized protein (DUF2141 family)